MMHPDTQVRFINETIGCGVFATKAIPKGTIVYVQDAMEIEVGSEEYASLPPVLREAVEKYSYVDPRGFRIVSWDHAKYVNHCCRCNTMSTGYGFEIAIRDICEGEEITDEYGLFNLSYEMPLSCAQPNCRGKVSSYDLDNYYQEWDRQVQQALYQLMSVDQPLYPLIKEEVRDDLERYLHGSMDYQSVSSLKLQ